MNPSKRTRKTYKKLTTKAKSKSKKNRNKRYVRKTIKGGFLSEASYFGNKVYSFISVDPTPPFGNTSIPVPPFPYFQTK